MDRETEAHNLATHPATAKLWYDKTGCWTSSNSKRKYVPKNNVPKLGRESPISSDIPIILIDFAQVEIASHELYINQLFMYIQVCNLKIHFVTIIN